MSEEPLILTGELLVTEDGAIVVGREELASALYDWCHGRAESVRVTVEEVDEQ